MNGLNAEQQGIAVAALRSAAKSIQRHVDAIDIVRKTLTDQPGCEHLAWARQGGLEHARTMLDDVADRLEEQTAPQSPTMIMIDWIGHSLAHLPHGERREAFVDVLTVLKNAIDP